jgi:hypothetical protein
MFLHEKQLWEALMSGRISKTSGARTTGRTTVRRVPANRRADAESQEEKQATRTQAPMSVQPVEPEDAHLTGVKHAQQHRLLELNAAGQSIPHPETAPGIHSTGSFTGQTYFGGKEPKEKAGSS